MMRNKLQLFIFLCMLLQLVSAFAAERTVNLTVAYKTVYFSGQPRKAIAVNNQIPAPELHFKEGDHVTINVNNKLDKETAIHWHGIILPWQMDGVLGVTQKGIKPGSSFKYQFTLHQSGTYWYHAHAGLQEQQGLYGAFIIDPLQPPVYHYTKDYVIVLSDWSNTHPDQIHANLKKEGDYYSPRFPLQPSLFKFIHDYKSASTAEKAALVDDYKMMQQMRMSIYDFSDVAYDAFLLNGRPNYSPWTAPVKVGDVVRLRFIGAGGSTIFHVKIPDAKMKIIHVDGNDVRPYSVNDFSIAPGETYDVLVKIEKDNPYIIYAESADTLGAAYGALITKPHQYVNYHRVLPFPKPLPVTRTMMSMPSQQKNDMHAMMDMSHASMSHHQMQHTMSTEPSMIGDTLSLPHSISTTRSVTKYTPLTAAVKTNDANKPIARVINMELFGYMDRYIWFINGVPEHQAKPIILEPGKRYRFVFTNPSMMHHPMHIHGHWFILREGKGEYDPLLHTIDVPPGATMTADLDTDASGQWLFHCHLLYHMMSGMSRVFQYASLIELERGEIKPQHIAKQSAYYNRPIVREDEVRPIAPELVAHPMPHPDNLWYASFFDLGEDPFHDAQRLSYKGLYGSDYNKLELFVNDAELYKGNVENADIDIFYWHLLDQFWALKGGANYTYRPANKPYWQPGIGLEGLMPYFIHTDVRGYLFNGAVKLDIELARDNQITNNLFIRVGIRAIAASKTVSSAEIGSGLNQMRLTLRPYYRLAPGLNIYAEYEYEQDYGSFKRMQTSDEGRGQANTITLGLSAVF